jgi:hypothetical protein
MAACTLFAASAFAQSARDIRGPSPLVAIENEPPAKLIVDPPVCTENSNPDVLMVKPAEDRV